MKPSDHLVVHRISHHLVQLRLRSSVPVARMLAGDVLQRVRQVLVLLFVAPMLRRSVVPGRTRKPPYSSRQGDTECLLRLLDHGNLLCHGQPLWPEKFVKARSPLPSCTRAAPDPGFAAHTPGPSSPSRRPPAPTPRIASSTAEPSCGGSHRPWRSVPGSSLRKEPPAPPVP